MPKPFMTYEQQLIKLKNEKHLLIPDEVNEAVKKVTENNPSFGYNADGIVSSDIIGTTFGSVFDPTQTQVVGKGDGQVVKVVAWYDNEYGFTSQMIRTLEKFASMI